MITIIIFLLSLLSTILFNCLVFKPFTYINIFISIGIFIGSIIALYIIYVLFIVIIALTINKKKEYKKSSKFLQWLTANLSSTILFITNTKVKVENIEKIPKNTRFLFVSNHKNAFDPICYNYILNGYDVGFISKKENFDLPIISNLVHREFYLPLDRENAKEGMKTIIKAYKLCQDNVCSIGLYPEGTRNKTDKLLLEFKTGGFKIAQKSNIPIVVSVIKNKNKATPNPFKKSIIEIEIVDVIYPENFGTSTHEIGDKVYNIMLEKLKNK